MTDIIPDFIYVMPYSADTIGGYRDGTWSKDRSNYHQDQIVTKYIRADTVPEAVNGDLFQCLREHHFYLLELQEAGYGSYSKTPLFDKTYKSLVKYEGSEAKSDGDAKIDTGITLLRFVAALEEIRDVIYPDEKGITDFGIQQNLKFLLSHMRMTAQKALQSLSDKD